MARKNAMKNGIYCFSHLVTLVSVAHSLSLSNGCLIEAFTDVLNEVAQLKFHCPFDLISSDHRG